MLIQPPRATLISREILRVLQNSYDQLPVGTSAPLDLSAEQWDRLAVTAHYHGIGPLCYEYYQTIGVVAAEAGVTITPQALGVLSDSFYQSAMNTTGQQQRLVEIIKLLASVSVDALVLCGPLLAAHYYTSPLHRPMSDLDILIHPQDLLLATQVLACAGWSSPAGELPFLFGDPRATDRPFTKGGICLELHWRLLPAIGMTRSVCLEDAEFWANTTTTTILGTAARTLCPEDLLFYSSVHLYKHEFRRIIWLYDIALATRQIRNWDRVIDMARRANARTAVYCCLYLVRDLFGAPVPDATLSALHRPAWQYRLAQQHLLPLEDTYRTPPVVDHGRPCGERPPSVILHLLLVDRVRYGLAVGLAKIVPPAEILINDSQLAKPLAVLLLPLLIVLRWLRLLRGCF